MKREGKTENLLKQHFRFLIHVWEFDRKCKLITSGKITKEERSHVVDFLFWLQEQECQIQEPYRFEAKIAYDAHCWAAIEEANKNAN